MSIWEVANETSVILLYGLFAQDLLNVGLPACVDMCTVPRRESLACNSGRLGEQIFVTAPQSPTDSRLKTTTEEKYVLEMSLKF